jgi:hypothetical protein
LSITSEIGGLGGFGLMAVEPGAVAALHDALEHLHVLGGARHQPLGFLGKAQFLAFDLRGAIILPVLRDGLAALADHGGAFGDADIVVADAVAGVDDAFVIEVGDLLQALQRLHAVVEQARQRIAALAGRIECGA